MLESLDRIDRKLLRELDLNSRQTYSQLAKKLRLGSDLIEYRVEKYKSQGLIGKFSALVDPFSMGWWVVKNYLKIISDSKKYEKLLVFLKAQQNTYWLAELNGRSDLIYSFYASSSRDCSIYSRKLAALFGEIFLEHDVCIPTRIVRFNKKYLSTGPSVTFIQDGAKEIKDLDAIDALLIKQLYENARITAVELADITKLSPATVRSRIEALEKTGVILGYRLQLNYDQESLLLFKLLLQFSDYSAKLEIEFFEFCKSHPNVTCYISQIGKYPVEIEVEVGSYRGMNNFIEEFRLRFDRGIRSFETLMIKRDLYHRFPGLIVKSADA